MSVCGIRLLVLHGRLPSPPALIERDDGGIAEPGDWLASYDPEWEGGRGRAIWTAHLANAMHFSSGGAALKCWRTVARSDPVRFDGKPNRPLSALTVEVGPFTEEPA